MSKKAEIDYIENIALDHGVPLEEVHTFLRGKPFTDARRSWALIDLGQILRLLPPPPLRLLDLGVGSGWTSRFFALAGYDVVGLDIAPGMIELARQAAGDTRRLQFDVQDYEHQIDAGEFDCVVIYDALHHALDEGRVIANAWRCLKPGGMFLTAEPGRGHAQADHSRDAVARFGTTEKDMEFERQLPLMQAAGFTTVRRYYRLSELPLEDVTTSAGRRQQAAHFDALAENTCDRGFTSLVVAVK